jgi:hypothetical protein
MAGLALLLLWVYAQSHNVAQHRYVFVRHRRPQRRISHCSQQSLAIQVARTQRTSRPWSSENGNRPGNHLQKQDAELVHDACLLISAAVSQCYLIFVVLPKLDVRDVGSVVLG